MLATIRRLAPWPKSVRGRLLGAFSILALSTLTLAVVGWVGLHNTENAISGFEAQVLPDIARSLELAERTANLAAVAPYVADASAPFQLKGESERLRRRAANVAALARRIPELGDAAPAMTALLADLQQTLDELIRRTRKELFLREDVRQQLFRLDQIDRRSSESGMTDSERTRFRALVDGIAAGASADSVKSVARFRGTVRGYLDSLAPGQAIPIATLRRMALGDGGVFPLRKRQLELHDRKAFLLAKLRAISERLSGEVTSYVQSLQNRVTQQSDSVAKVVASARTGIALIAMICVAAVALGVYIVQRLVGNLKAATGVMTRLAEGDTEQTTPATGRADEMGSLARAFEVFRANAVALRQAHKMEVLGQLTGGVAHDFNNLLAAVVGNLQMLEDRLDDSSAGRFAARALAAAERGDALTSRLLAFARRQHLKPERIGTDTLLEGMRDLLAYSVGSGVRLVQRLDSGDAPIHVDRGQLENALLNLAINASAAMPQGGELVFATAAVGSDAGQSGGARVLIAVSDTGQGMSTHQKEQVFEPFYSTKPFGKGSGLGLSIVYGFVKQSGGDVRIDSAPGKGTSVTLDIPRDMHERAVGGNADGSDVAFTDGQHAPCESLGILVVEDDAEVRDMITAMLEQLGHVVVTAADAEAAETLAQQTPFDLLITDMNLGPGEDGLTLANRLAERFAGLRVLLTSGLAREQLIEHYGLPEKATLLKKPYRRKALIAAIRHARQTAG